MNRVNRRTVVRGIGAGAIAASAGVTSASGVEPDSTPWAGLIQYAIDTGEGDQVTQIKAARFGPDGTIQVHDFNLSEKVGEITDGMEYVGLAAATRHDPENGGRSLTDGHAVFADPDTGEWASGPIEWADGAE